MLWAATLELPGDDVAAITTSSSLASVEGVVVCLCEAENTPTGVVNRLRPGGWSSSTYNSRLGSLKPDRKQTDSYFVTAVAEAGHADCAGVMRLTSATPVGDVSSCPHLGAVTGVVLLRLNIQPLWSDQSESQRGAGQARTTQILLSLHGTSAGALPLCKGSRCFPIAPTSPVLQRRYAQPLAHIKWAWMRLGCNQVPNPRLNGFRYMRFLSRSGTAAPV
eukprot:411909-Prorocentrum_minimum.AAC.4